MKILFINPFGSNWVEGRLDKSVTAVRMAPIGILSIAAYLKERGAEVSVVSTRLPAGLGGAEEVMGRVRSFRPDVVGFTATTSGFPDAYSHAEAIKRVVPDVKIVFGGVHVSALREKVLESYPAIDFLVTGEGEKAMASLAAGEDPASIQGIVYRGGSGIKSTGLRTDLCVLDELPFPAYRSLDGFPREFEAPLFNYPKAPSATIISSRGCPYQCSYCDRSVFRRSFRFNSAGYLYEHMRFLRREFGVRHIFFYDDLFTFHRGRIEELCGMLGKKPLGMTFNCAVRVGHIDDDLLRMLKAAGCWMVSLGIESGDRELLARHKSNVDPEEMKKSVRQIQRNGLRVKGLFMMGLPGETETTIRKTQDFIAELELDDMNMTKFTPFPGSPIYQTINEEGAFEEKWALMNCLNFVFVPKGISSKERLDELYNQSVKRFYTSRNWVRKFVPLMFKSPDSAVRMMKNLPTYLKIKDDFEPAGKG
jgi:radical SAM superfamily enzyme YgiQ (UPF0313 family)